MIVIPCTSITDRVVVFINVSCLVSNLNVVGTSYSMPVILAVVRPLSRVGMLVIVVPSTSVTDTVVVFINVSCLVSNLDGVSTGYCMPVVGSVVRPSVSIGVSVIVVPSTSLADTVVVLVLMLSLVGYNVVSAGCSVPVIGLIVSPFFSKFVLAELIFTGLADTVVVFINVSGYILAGNSVRRI